MAGMMTELRALSPELRVEAHLIELEAMGYTVVHDAIPPALLVRLQANHRQLIQRVRECKPPEDWSAESDKPGVVDAWRLYDLDPAYEELLTLPNVFPIIDRAIREGRGRPAHAGGPRLYHEMAQHMPAGTPGGQAWHRDGDLIRCTFTLNDLGPRDGVRERQPLRLLLCYGLLVCWLLAAGLATSRPPAEYLCDTVCCARRARLSCQARTVKMACHRYPVDAV
jgi:hypothetical protein